MRADLEEVLKAADRAAGLTSQLLAFSRKQAIVPKVIQLDDILKSSFKMLSRIIGEDIELLSKQSPGLWQIKADPAQLDQILINLAANARDAMPDGGTLTIETANVVQADASSLGLEESRSGEFVMLAVRDTGKGIPKKNLEHIFDPFYSTKEKDKGIGLGLSTVYGIVKQNNGFVQVESELNQGAIFRVFFPAIEQELESLTWSETGAQSIGTESVLLVEDDGPVRRLARQILEKHGYSVVDKETGEQALTYAQELKEVIDLLVTDVVLPGMNGRELFEHLEKERPGLKALFTSGYTGNVIALRGVLDEGTHFLQKPFDIESLARKVREVLDS